MSVDCGESLKGNIIKSCGYLKKEIGMSEQQKAYEKERVDIP